MVVHIGNDHGGYRLKGILVDRLMEKYGYEPKHIAERARAVMKKKR